MLYHFQKYMRSDIDRNRLVPVKPRDDWRCYCILRNGKIKEEILGMFSA